MVLGVKIAEIIFNMKKTRKMQDASKSVHIMDNFFFIATQFFSYKFLLEFFFFLIYL